MLTPTLIERVLALPLEERLTLAEAGRTRAARARRAGMSRPRVAEIGAHKPGPSFDNLQPVFFAADGTSAELADLVRATDDSMSR